MKIPEHHLRASMGDFEYGVTGLRCLTNPQDGYSTIHANKRIKGPEGTNLLWIYTAADYSGQIPWTYSGRQTDLEGTAENVMNKAYRAFWTCKGITGKTWGLKSGVLHWIYTILIRPVLTSSSTVWLPRVRQNISRTKLNKLQTSGYLAITWEMKMSPTAAMEVLLRLTPLHVMIKADGQVGIYRLMCTQQWRPKSTSFGHTKKSQDMEHKPVIHMGFDRMLPRYAQFPDKCEWQNGLQSDNKGGLVWYTDGTKTNKSTDAGAQEARTALVLGSTPQHFMLRYMPLRLV
jgi:hypothetical protein